MPPWPTCSRMRYGPRKNPVVRPRSSIRAWKRVSRRIRTSARARVVLLCTPPRRVETAVTCCWVSNPLSRNRRRNVSRSLVVGVMAVPHLLFRFTIKDDLQAVSAHDNSVGRHCPFYPGDGFCTPARRFGFAHLRRYFTKKRDFQSRLRFAPDTLGDEPSYRPRGAFARPGLPTASPRVSSARRKFM